FEKSMRVKGMIDELAVRVQTEPNWRSLAALLRSEYRLWKLNVDTPIRVNPFLSHWVEAILRLNAATQGYRPILDNKGAIHGAISALDIAATRLEMLKELLKYGSEALMTATPQSLFTTRFPPKPFDIRPFIRMLEEEGIYEPSPAAPPPNLTIASRFAHTDTPSPSASSIDSPDIAMAHLPMKLPLPAPGTKWKELILLNLETQPAVAVHQLTHLPIAIAALDFLTTLITGLKLGACNLNPKSLVLSFVQHALRIIEHIGQPPDPTSPPPPETDIGMPTFFGYGRDAQARAMQLLLLFVRNLMNRGFVDVYPTGEYTLYYDIQDICTQYLWIKDVRDFKAWIDEG
ncbi:uncharacterized protein M421DRAFT_26927, partial [Didymella exigua CBS 183.55]